ncbi:helicase-related protein [Lichenihabitans sp. Uapishka_5]|uniref:DEAD/DEAH box helicase n=1 Tax=Lichenihabitans sp. Uapishka_5 TaxID=3037302 RepID=UPI0029E7D8ED|nr:DEAD/DEAH box helicase [Lichenihabitans sp. Uapishka_5]MDX7950605.1 helicase-related protein [Lichenihabitans sp. Uapishka_5]
MDESVSLLAVRLLQSVEAEGGVLVVVECEQKAESLARLVSQLAPDHAGCYLPAWDCLPYDRAPPSADLMGLRMRVLADAAVRSPAYVITTPEAAVQRLPPCGALPKPLVLKVGATVDLVAFARACTAIGFHHSDRVDDPGQFAIRGEVVDIFAAVARPYRIGIEAGRIGAIHRYDPATQRSVSEVSAIRIDAMSEVVLPDTDPTRAEGIEHRWPEYYDGSETIFDLVPDAAMLIEPQAARRLDRLFGEIDDAYRDRKATDAASGSAVTHILPPQRLYLDRQAWDAATNARARPFPDTDGGDVPRFCLDDKPGQAFSAYLADAMAQGQRVVLGAARERELVTMAKQAERATCAVPQRIDRWADLAGMEGGSVALIRISADHGFVDEPGAAVLVTAADLLGHHARALSTRAAPVPWHLGDGDFMAGDVVIHLDHGMGMLKDLETVQGGGGHYDAVRLRFADDADLLVPVDQLDRLWRYGGAGASVTLDKLGGHAWPKRQAQLARDIQASATALVAASQARRKVTAPKIVPPRRDYERFVAGFAFAPTADQMHAIDDCLRDLAGTRPMDRLIVGDVGFGKTEVALRAAAAAVLAGHQVAIVAPTTVLARQHMQCFQHRFAALGIEVAQLSRLVAPAEVKRVKAGLADGTIRLVIGTQALCDPGMVFKDLGLLIIDEEQRFGADDKAQVRVLGRGVHVLVMTATPIPRTLQSALAGLQDLSVIATPPARRRPIRTLLEPFDTAVLRAALLKEKGRSGQSFVVVPRIEDLLPLSRSLQGLVPELSLKVAHGEMPVAEIDDTMTAFAAGDGDVLLATSIIESGLDVPRANTMVICRADRFGLAELHQMRGRVGRGRHQGVCYLMTEPGHDLAPATARRLATLARLDRLGSGMAISAQDLDARGAGDLIGEHQAGHGHLIGLGLYQHLLQRALQALGSGQEDDWVPELHLGDAGALTEAYIPEPELRLNLYARLARASDAHDLDLLVEEIEDRFGPLPPEAAALLARARLRCLCRSHRIARVDVGPKAIAFTPCRGTRPEDLIGGAAAPPKARISKGRLLFDVVPSAEVAERLEMSSHLLQGLG